MAYHTWLYHFLGGAGAKLLPPPDSTATDETRWSATLRAHALRGEADYKREVERLRHRGAAGEQELLVLRCAPVEPSILRPAGDGTKGAAPPLPQPLPYA